jgi:hypothetical protein
MWLRQSDDFQRLRNEKAWMEAALAAFSEDE